MRLDLYQNVNKEIALKAIGINIEDIERFRGAGVQDGEIIIHARTGGGNRENYPNEILTSNPYYLRDEDDGFDCTYADYYFSIPEELKDEVEKTEDKEAKAVLGDAKVAIGINFGDKDAIKTAKKRLDKVRKEQ